MSSASASRFRSIRTSLRARVAIGVALPVFLASAGLAVVHGWRELQLIEEQIQLTALQVGEVVLGGLRHALMENDRPHTAQVLEDVGGMENIQDVQLIDLAGRVIMDSTNASEGLIRHTDDIGCKECHNAPIVSRPQTVFLTPSHNTRRISAPIDNQEACQGCHQDDGTHLGVLLIDVSLVDTRAHLLIDLKQDLAISIIITLLVTAGVYLLMHILVVRRVEAYSQPLTEYANGVFSSRLPTPNRPLDELDRFAITFNRMADSIDRTKRQLEERHELRQQAIVEERERIAREMHDGLAQLLGYVNTKAMAVRLMLKNGRLPAAEKHLLQLEEAARELFVDVREAIVGLRISDDLSAGMAHMLEDFIGHFGRLSGIEVNLVIDSNMVGLTLPVETELHLLRIVQESLTNIRKHACTSEAWVYLNVQDHLLELVVGDNGVGFDPAISHTNRRPHFGLSTMHERAEAIGASLNVNSKPGEGTRITVQLPIGEERN